MSVKLQNLDLFDLFILQGVDQGYNRCTILSQVAGKATQTIANRINALEVKGLVTRFRTNVEGYSRQYILTEKAVSLLDLMYYDLLKNYVVLEKQESMSDFSLDCRENEV